MKRDTEDILIELLANVMCGYNSQIMSEEAKQVIRQIEIYVESRHREYVNDFLENKDVKFSRYNSTLEAIKRIIRYK